jgi:nucleoside-diphosphate-sugar epimerase
MSSHNATDTPAVLVTGASGFIGGRLACALASRGYDVRVLARASSDLSSLQTIDYRRFEGDLTDPVSLIAAVSNADYIYHVGGLIKAPSDDVFAAVNGEGTKNLAAAARTHAPGLKRLLYVSSIAAVGPGPPGGLIDELTPARPITPYGASKRLGEKWLQQFDCHWTIVRPPAVYGPGDRGMFDLFQLAARHIRPTLGSDGRISVAYVDNLVEGIILAAERPEGVGQIFVLTDGEVLGRKQLARMIKAAVNTWAVPIHFPAWVVRSVARLSEAVATGFGRVAFFDRHKARELLATNWACNIDKAKLLLGYAPAVPTAEGLKKTAAWYRQEGWI